MLKIQYGIVLLFIIFLADCKSDDSARNGSADRDDTIPPEIKLFGKLIDTAYLNTFYINPGAYAVSEAQDITIKTSGIVNTKKLDTCYLFYDAVDAAGNNAATLTRTVYVAKSNAAALSGTYDVACTCTAVSVASKVSTVTANNYTASVTLSQTNNKFEIVQLNLGFDYVIPIADLNHNAIKLEIYRNSSCISSGTLSSTKNTFTIETSTSTDSPNIHYNCKNSYTKKLPGS